MNVRDVMTTQVVTITESQTKQQAARLLAHHRISGVPVIDAENFLVGVISEYDILAKAGELVSEIMTRSVISVSADTELEEVSRLFVHEHIRRLPVLEHGRVIGIVSRADLVREIALRWLCPVCGEVTYSEKTLERCPRCWTRDVFASSEQEVPGS